MNAIEITELTKTYGKVRGITGLTLNVEKGEYFGFIGPNGAGKSTTIRTLLGYIRPDGGSAFVLGKDIRTASEKIRAVTGYLPSEAIFYRGMKVRDILKLSADLRGTDCRAEAKRLCERLELDTSRRADELSFGNRKKVAIVCALQHKPNLLILDEPTSGLDPLMQREFFSIIRERNRSGVTVFLSSHILSEIEHNCTRAAIIREGSIISCDKVKALSDKSAKRITLRYDDASDMLHALSGMEGVKDYAVSENGIQQFLYSGSMDALVKMLSGTRIADLTIEEPDLEEIFLHFYEEAS